MKEKEAKELSAVSVKSPRPALEQGKIMYVAAVEWNRAKLASFVVKSETPKTVTRDARFGITDLVGQIVYVPERLLRNSYNLFDSRDDAIVWLGERVMKEMSALQTRVNDLNSDKVQLRNLLNEPAQEMGTTTAR